MLLKNKKDKDWQGLTERTSRKTTEIHQSSFDGMKGVEISFALFEEWLQKQKKKTIDEKFCEEPWFITEI